MKLNKVLIVYYVHNYSTLDKAKKCLQKHKIAYRAIKREFLTPGLCRASDLVIVIGGDGTFLRTAQKIFDQTPVLSVSSDTKYNEAFYSRATPGDFCEKFEKIRQNKFRITKLRRLEARINGKKIKTLAVNEIFIGNSKPYHTSRYVLEVKRKKEFQKSSGIIIATNSGNTGWAGSASKKELSIPKNSFGYVVREAYRGKLTRPKLLQGALKPGDALRITSEMHEGILVMDSSYEEHKFTDGFSAEVRISRKDLNLIEFF